jgi:hypothetical protein
MKSSAILVIALLGYIISLCFIFLFSINNLTFRALAFSLNLEPLQLFATVSALNLLFLYISRKFIKIYEAKLREVRK